MHIEQKITELTEAVNRLNLNLETLIRVWPKPAGQAQPAATVTPIGQAAQDTAQPAKRGPGRPPGSGKKATLAAVPNGNGADTGDAEAVASEFEQGPAPPPPAMDYTGFKEVFIGLIKEGRDQDVVVAILRAAPPKGFGKQAFTELTAEEYPRMLEVVRSIPITLAPITS